MHLFAPEIRIFSKFLLAMVPVYKGISILFIDNRLYGGYGSPWNLYVCHNILLTKVCIH